MSDAIVVGTDGSTTARNAVHEAAEIARQRGATVHLVSAYSPTAGQAWAAPVAHTIDDSERVEGILKQAAEEVRSAGVPVETYPICGPAADALVGVAETQNASLIVVGNKGMTGAGRFLGSVPNRVTHHAPCSVLIVRTA